MMSDQLKCMKPGHELEDILGICRNELCKANKRTFCLLCLQATEHGKCKNNFYNKKQFLEKLSELKTKIQQDKLPNELQLLSELAYKANQFIQSLEQFTNNYVHNHQQAHIQRIDLILEKQDLISFNDWEQGYMMMTNQALSVLPDTTNLIEQLKQIQQTIDKITAILVNNKKDIHSIMPLVKSKWNDITINAKSPIWSMTCSSDGKYIACGCNDKVIRVFEPESGTLVSELKGHTSWIAAFNYKIASEVKGVRALSYSPNNKYIASGSLDNTIRIWNMDQLKQDGEPMIGHRLCVYTVSFSPNGLFLASGGSDESIRIWSMQDRKEIKCLNGHTDCIHTVDYSLDGKLLASGGGDMTIKLWNTETWLQLGYSLKGHTNPIYCLKFSKNGKNLISGSEDKSIRLWDVVAGKELKCYNGHTSRVWCVIYSPDEQFIISGSEDKSIRVWNITTGQSLLMKGHNSEVTSLSISPDGQYLISAGQDSLQVQKLTQGMKSI